MKREADGKVSETGYADVTGSTRPTLVGLVAWNAKRMPSGGRLSDGGVHASWRTATPLDQGVLDTAFCRSIPAAIHLSCMESIDLPLAGGLSQESVANRTLLIGPAGGFYTAWRRTYSPRAGPHLVAAEVAQALGERHLQDAIQPYRERWLSAITFAARSRTFASFFRSAHCNPVMTVRISEAILGLERWFDSKSKSQPIRGRSGSFRHDSVCASNKMLRQCIMGCWTFGIWVN